MQKEKAMAEAHQKCWDTDRQIDRQTDGGRIVEPYQFRLDSDVTPASRGDRNQQRRYLPIKEQR